MNSTNIPTNIRVPYSLPKDCCLKFTELPRVCSCWLVFHRRCSRRTINPQQACPGAERCCASQGSVLRRNNRDFARHLAGAMWRWLKTLGAPVLHFIWKQQLGMDVFPRRNGSCRCWSRAISSCSLRQVSLVSLVGPSVSGQWSSQYQSHVMDAYQKYQTCRPILRSTATQETRVRQQGSDLQIMFLAD